MRERKNRYKLQGQAEAFAHAGVKKFSAEQRIFLQYSRELAALEDPQHPPESLPPELREAIQKNWDGYVHFSRYLSEENKAVAKFAEANAEIYATQWAPLIARLKQRIAVEGERNPQYLGHGSNGNAYVVQRGGQDYVAKFSTSATQANFELRALIRAQGVEHAAQLTAYSFEDQVVIMERLPGRDITHIPAEEFPPLQDEHIIQLIETVRALAARGCVIDPKQSNFMFDPEVGFSILDYHVREHAHGAEFEQVIEARSAVAGYKNDFKWPDREDPEGGEKIRQHSVQQKLFSMPRVIQYLRLVQNQYPDVVTQWKAQRAMYRADTKRSGGQIFNKAHVVDDPRVAEYVRQLEQMDEDGWIFS